MNKGRLATHPDENLLSAFVDHGLTQGEQQKVLEHVAVCARCRDIVFLTEEAGAESVDGPESTPLSAGRRWLWWGSLAAAGALAALLVAGPIVVYRYRDRVMQEPARNPTVAAPAARQAAQMTSLPEGVDALRGAPSQARQIVKSGHSASSTGRGEIKGSVADRTGAAISGASVSVRALSSGASHTATTDAKGQFDVAALPSGSYEVQVQAPGFNRFTEAVTVQPSERASLEAKLDAGSANQTVTVAAAAAPLTTTAPAASAMLAEGPAPPTTFPVKDGVVQRCTGAECVARTLPSNAKVVSAASNGQTVMAVDSDGNLFLSNDQGEHWEQAKVQWQGKAVGLRRVPDHPQAMMFMSTPSEHSAARATGGATHGAVAGRSAPVPAPLGAMFELTTDNGQVWVSLDEGKTWVAK